MSLILNGTEVKEITINDAKVDKLNYGGVEVYSSLPAPGKPLNDYTWAEISQIAQAGKGADYWNIGDSKEITLNGKIGEKFAVNNYKCRVFILDFNHEDNGVADNNIIFGGFKNSQGSDIALEPQDYAVLGSSAWNPASPTGTKSFSLNHCWFKSKYNMWTNNYGGWKGSDFRYDILGATSYAPSEYSNTALKTSANIGYDATNTTLINPPADTLLAAFPAEVRNVMRLWDRWITSYGSSSVVILKSTDAITLLSYYEIFGNDLSQSAKESIYQNQMAYYANGNNIKRNVYYYIASGTNQNIHTYINTSGYSSSTDAYRALGLAPAFKV